MKIIWYYDKTRKQWYCLESYSYSNDDFTIDKVGNGYTLSKHYNIIKTFKQLKNAKKVAELLRFG